MEKDKKLLPVFFILLLSVMLVVMLLSSTSSSSSKHFDNLSILDLALEKGITLENDITFNSDELSYVLSDIIYDSKSLIMNVQYSKVDGLNDLWCTGGVLTLISNGDEEKIFIGSESLQKGETSSVRNSLLSVYLPDKSFSSEDSFKLELIFTDIKEYKQIKYPVKFDLKPEVLEMKSSVFAIDSSINKGGVKLDIKEIEMSPTASYLKISSASNSDVNLSWHLIDCHIQDTDNNQYSYFMSSQTSDSDFYYLFASPYLVSKNIEKFYVGGIYVEDKTKYSIELDGNNLVGALPYKITLENLDKNNDGVIKSLSFMLDDEKIKVSTIPFFDLVSIYEDKTELSTDDFIVRNIHGVSSSEGTDETPRMEIVFLKPVKGKLSFDLSNFKNNFKIDKYFLVK